MSEVYDAMDAIADLAITSLDKSDRTKCSTAFVGFIVASPLGASRPRAYGRPGERLRGPRADGRPAAGLQAAGLPAAGLQAGWQSGSRWCMFSSFRPRAVRRHCWRSGWRGGCAERHLGCSLGSRFFACMGAGKGDYMYMCMHAYM